MRTDILHCRMSIMAYIGCIVRSDRIACLQQMPMSCDGTHAAIKHLVQRGILPALCSIPI